MAMLTRLRTLVLVVLATFAFARPAAAVDYTDIWWNPNESGWGVNFIQASNFIFATFFIYGTDQQPTWVTAQLTAGSNNVWTGPLYYTTGSFYGAPWNPNQQTTTQVGTATFVPTDSATGQLTYVVGTTTVVKTITRQTLKSFFAGGQYAGAVQLVYSGCSSGNGTSTYWTQLAVTQRANGTMRFAWQAYDANGNPFTFAMDGASVQQGVLYRLPGATYTFDSTTLTANMSQIRVTTQGIEGTWVSNFGQGCVENGYFSLLWVSQ
ncbi:MAG: hypothetical protein IT522_06130 [Burkholderiales bacterium]|nr:hypothetical protein [Burkholderiales bacterium]